MRRKPMQHLFQCSLAQVWPGCWWKSRERSSLFLLLVHQLMITQCKATLQVEASWLAKQRSIWDCSTRWPPTGNRHALMGGGHQLLMGSAPPSNSDHPVHAYTLCHWMNILVLTLNTLKTDSSFNGSRTCSVRPNQSTETKCFEYQVRKFRKSWEKE